MNAEFYKYGLCLLGLIILLPIQKWVVKNKPKSWAEVYVECMIMLVLLAALGMVFHDLKISHETYLKRQKIVKDQRKHQIERKVH